MSKDSAIVQVPNVLGQDIRNVETFFRLLPSTPLQTDCYFDMGLVEWLKPYGIIGLVLAARHLQSSSHHKVYLRNLGGEVHSYLDRMNVLGTEQEWLTVEGSLDEFWFRNPQTPNLLELTLIRSSSDVEFVADRARMVFSQWLTEENLGNLLNVLSELCANIYQHSEDPNGCVLIQKNESTSRNRKIVCLTVGDLGCGIEGSMTKRFGSMGTKPIDYLRFALGKHTSRASGRGGLGLQTAAGIAGNMDGFLWLRSRTAAILKRHNATSEHDDLPFIPGTQVTVQLEAPL